MKKTESNQRLIAAMKQAAAGTAYEIQIQDYPAETCLFIRKRDRRDAFTPEIYFEDAPYGDESASGFTVQAGNGAGLIPSEIEMVIAGLRAAADLAKTLTALVRQADQEEADR